MKELLVTLLWSLVYVVIIVALSLVGARVFGVPLVVPQDPISFLGSVGFAFFVGRYTAASRKWRLPDARDSANREGE